MAGRIRKSGKQREFIKAADVAGSEVFLYGLPFAITVPRNAEPTTENVKFVWLRRSLVGRSTDPNRGLRRRQVEVIKIFEALGLGKMVVKL